MVVYVQDGDYERTAVLRTLTGLVDEDVVFVRWDEHGEERRFMYTMEICGRGFTVIAAHDDMGTKERTIWRRKRMI
jgi:hypothetical protein